MADKVKAISLLSGGLDSLLAAKIVAAQGVEVTALHFISPFFGADKRGKEEELEAFYRDTYGIKAKVIDISDEYMELLGNPKHGYGKNFNPCIDCKIFLFKRALEIMEAEGAKFLITGEVVGQRPMSQRRDAMNTIAKQFGARDILLRPLCAKKLEPTKPELEGWVDREKLYDFNGRSRKPQIALAKELGMGDYPTPAGGCKLTDPCLAARARVYFDEVEPENRSAEDIRLLLSGRPFMFPGGSILTLGRSHEENQVITKMQQEGDELALVIDVPGPLGLFRPGPGEDERGLAASVLMRYCPKAGSEDKVGFGPSAEVQTTLLSAMRAGPDELEKWRR